MPKISNPRLTGNAQFLRREMTKEERHLWYDFLKPAGINAHRQKTIGPYIVDFYIASAKIVIELDGSQHFELTGQCADLKRDQYLNSLGIQVLRYGNHEVNRNFRGVCEDICHHLGIES